MKSQPTSQGLIVELIAASAVFSATNAVASLTMLSPSRMDTIRRGMPTRRATVVAATASVGATTAPSANAAARLVLGTTHQAARPTATAVNATSPTESNPIA